MYRELKEKRKLIFPFSPLSKNFYLLFYLYCNALVAIYNQNGDDLYFFFNIFLQLILDFKCIISPQNVSLALFGDGASNQGQVRHHSNSLQFVFSLWA